MTRRQPAACVFCKCALTRADRTREHVIPEWLQQEWKLTGNRLSPTHYDSHGNVLSTREHNFGALLAGRVCRSCNGGWMSELETKCRSLILSLASGRRRIISLADEEALLLARWSVKTAYALHSASNLRRIVDDSHYQVLDQRDYRLPQGVFVLGHTYQTGRSVCWIQSATWEVFDPVGRFTAEQQRALFEQSYKISLRIGGLFLSVVYNPIPDAQLCLFFGSHIPLYPRWSYPVSWTRRHRAWPSNMDKRLLVFHYAIRLVFADWNPFPKGRDIDDPRSWTKVVYRKPTTLIHLTDLASD